MTSVVWSLDAVNKRPHSPNAPHRHTASSVGLQLAAALLRMSASAHPGRADGRAHVTKGRDGWAGRSLLVPFSVLLLREGWIRLDWRLGRTRRRPKACITGCMHVPNCR